MAALPAGHAGLNRIQPFPSMEVGLDVGTGFVKVSANGKKVSFPSLYSCMYSDRRSITDASGRDILRECVGMDAIRMGRNRNANMLRPVKHGLPARERGFLALVRKALKSVDVTEPADTTICVGITFDARDGRRKIERLIKSLKPRKCMVLPQAYGTLVSLNKSTGVVVNIGHGTTEIIIITPGNIDGISIPKGGELVMSQLGRDRGDYVHHERLFTENPEKTARLVEILAEHIADELSRMIGAGKGQVILAGGGSMMPNMKETIEGLIGMPVTVPADPVFSNAIGLEMMARKDAARSQGTHHVRPDGASKRQTSQRPDASPGKP